MENTIRDPFLLHTPCYILKDEEYRENLRGFRDTFREQWGGLCLFGYSVKTNHLRWPLSIAREEGYLTETVSPDEYACVRGLGVPHREIIYNGPHKGDLLLPALRKGALVNLDSLEECEQVIRAAKRGEIPDSPRLGLRVNFDLEARCPGETTCGREVSRFGICAENGDLALAFRSLRDAGIPVSGLPMHQSSSSRSLRIFRAIAEEAVLVAKDLGLSDPAFVDLGGGFFGGSFFPGKPTIPEYAETVCTALRQGFDPAKTTLILEPGAGVLATAMDYLASVVNFRRVRDRQIVTLDGALLHINPMMRPHPTPFTMLNPGEPMAEGEREQWIVAGSTCMEMDRFEPRGMDHRPLPESRFLFHCCGAYMATHNSNFINASPAIYLLKAGEYTLLRASDPSLMERI